MAVVLALAAAIAYGLSDFVGGVVSRRTSAWPVAVAAAVASSVGTLVLALVLPGDPRPADFAWGALAGLGSGAGTVFLYRGFAAGRMGVVAPVSAVGAALLPAAIGILGGERPAPLVWIGMLAALPGIWLVAREPGDGQTRGSVAAGLRDGVLAGVGFGLLFAALGQVPESAGYWPVLGNQVVALVAVVVAGLLVGADPLPRRPEHWWGGVAGLLATLAIVGFLVARQQGLLSVSAVLTSLYPAATVLLASVVLHERLHRTQSVGLVLCGVSVVCVALG